MNVEKKNQLIERIKTLEGLTGEERSNLLDLLRTSYGLVWEDRPEEVEEHLREAMPVLIEDKGKALTDGGSDAPNHVLIEGDNLEALTTLAYTHAGKIDVIYIDPPYNTGNKDFVYNDSFVDSEDSYRHSKWLSFMAKRLRIAKKLLSDDGITLIQCDDNESANVKLLCDNIFGESNALGPFIQNKLNAKNDSLNVQKNHEYIYCYRKRQKIDSVTNKEVQILSSVKTETIDVIEENGEFYYFNDAITTRGEGGTLRRRPNLGYSFYYNPDENDFIPYRDYDPSNIPSYTEEAAVYNDNIDLVTRGYSIIIRPPRVRNELGVWTWDIDKSLREKKNLIVVKTRKGYNVRKRTFVPKNDVIENNGTYYFIKKTKSNSKSILEYSTNEGSSVFNEIFNHAVEFNNPKNVSLIKYLIGLYYLNDITVLDFFAGSGTTLHAVMQLNAEDGGHRQCILVTNNENGICENVTYERNKRVIEGYTKSNGDRVEGLSANNLRYYRIDFVQRTQSPHDLSRLVELSTDMLCIKEDLYNPAEIDCNGKKIAKRFARRFQKGDREMIIIYEPKVIPFIVEHIKAREVKHEIKVYVNAPGRYAFDDDFSEVIEKITLCAIPDAILQAYRDVLPKAKDQELPPVNIDEDEIKKALEADSDYSYTDEKGGDQ